MAVSPGSIIGSVGAEGRGLLLACFDRQHLQRARIGFDAQRINGDLEQTPLHKVGLIASESLRVEPFATQLKVLPIEDSQK